MQDDDTRTLKRESMSQKRKRSTEAIRKRIVGQERACDVAQRIEVL